jgi:4-hydroxy-4-methyl-2-oxoglutarate aldolase
MLTTAHIADACLRTGVPVRCAPSGIQAVAPSGIQAVIPGRRVQGRALPVCHAGSVDVFLEAFESAAPGDILVVDNGGRLDEACVGDLIALEAQAAGLGGIVIWGLHRDTADIAAIGLPVFSLGSLPAGPLTIRDPQPQWPVTRDDIVVGDEDGVLFLPVASAEEVFATAETIRDTERRQADLIRAGRTLRTQVKFDVYLASRANNPSLTFREHLRNVGGEIEV